MELKKSLVTIAKGYLTSFQEALRDPIYPARVSPTPRNKVATGKTLRSLRQETTFQDDRMARIQIFGDESYDRIIQGQAPRTVFPGRGSGNSFRLDPALEEWKRAVGYQGSDYRLAFGIFVRGIQPADVTTRALNIAGEKDLQSEILTFHARDIREKILNGFIQG